MNEMRARYLRDKVMTATPAQRVVMLYDRLALDLTRAKAAPDPMSAGAHISHATQIVAELFGSLNVSAGGPAANLASIYPYLLGELMAARSSADPAHLDIVESVVAKLHESWASVAVSTAVFATDTSTRAASAWVG